MKKSQSKKLIKICLGCFVLLCGIGLGDTAIECGTSMYQNHIQNTRVSQAQQGLPRNITTSAPVNNPHFHAVTMPKSLQGCYIDNVPIKYPNINKYYHITSIVRIAPHDIYQQFVLSNRNLPKKLIPVKYPHNFEKKQAQVAKIHRIVTQHTPPIIMHNIYRTKLNTQVQSYNIDMLPGNMKQSGNMFKFAMKQQTMVAGYTPSSLTNIIGYSSAIAVPPEMYGHIMFYIDKSSNNIGINGKQFKKVSNNHIIKIMKQAQVHPYFVGL